MPKIIVNPFFVLQEWVTKKRLNGLGERWL